eukprot:SAG31_NODE_3821_length_3852_cov_4.553424_2_plen_150_part_00
MVGSLASCLVLPVKSHKLCEESAVGALRHLGTLAENCFKVYTEFSENSERTRTNVTVSQRQLREGAPASLVEREVEAGLKAVLDDLTKAKAFTKAAEFERHLIASLKSCGSFSGGEGMLAASSACPPVPLSRALSRCRFRRQIQQDHRD